MDNRFNADPNGINAYKKITNNKVIEILRNPLTSMNYNGN